MLLSKFARSAAVEGNMTLHRHHFSTTDKVEGPNEASPSIQQSNNPSNQQGKLNANKFYGEYHGHRIKDLHFVHDSLREWTSGKKPMIYLAGDSSMDNKYWFNDKEPACNGYDNILSPSVSKVDIAHCLNKRIVELNMGGEFSVLNCAIEESAICDREERGLLPQDEFIRDTITENDILIVSLGGNDIALKPSVATIGNVAALLHSSTTSMVENFSAGYPLPLSISGMNGLIGTANSFLAAPPGLGYLIHLFGPRIQAIINRLVSISKPKLIIVCMVYYPDETSGNSWADNVLHQLGYNANPAHLQAIMRAIFRLGTSSIQIDGTKVVAVPLYEALDGKTTADYSQRVEPSAVGGEKIARLLLDEIIKHYPREELESSETSQKI